MEYNKSPVQLNSGVVGEVGKVGNTASSYSETIIMPEPQGLIRIDWWGHTFVQANGKGVGGSGRCEFNIDGAIWKGPAKFSVQGSSSVAHPKKNMKMRPKNSEGEDLLMQIGTSVPSKDWVWKADYTDSSKCANMTAYRLFERMTQERKGFPKYDVDRYWVNDSRDAPFGQPTGATGMITNYPAVMYHNDEFYGIGTVILKQDTSNMNVYEDEDLHISFEYDSRGGENPRNWINMYPESPHVQDLYPEEWTQPRRDAVQRLGDFINSPQAEFNQNWEGIINKDNAIDMILMAEFLYDYDATSQDLNFVSYDAHEFFMLPYDKDTVFGIPWSASGSIMPPTGILVSKTASNLGLQFFKKIRVAFSDDVDARYAELRDKNIFSKEGVLEIARGATQYFSKELFEMELERWPNTFVQENTVARIGRWIEQRLEVLDVEYNYS